MHLQLDLHAITELSWVLVLDGWFCPRAGSIWGTLAALLASKDAKSSSMSFHYQPPLYILFTATVNRARPVWVQPIPTYVSGWYFCQYRYIWIYILATKPIPIFFLSWKFANHQWKCQNMPICWSISKLFNLYLVDIEISYIYLANNRYQFLYPVCWYQYQVYPYRYIGQIYLQTDASV